MAIASFVLALSADVHAGYDETFKLTASDAAAGDTFGSGAISGNIAIIGAILDDDAGADSGSAYVFDVTTGTELFKLTASDAAAGDRFGTVAISGNTAIVGAAFNDDSGTDSGSAYLFDVTTGTELFKLTASDAAAGDQFGRVAISGSTAIVGAFRNDDAGTDSGSAYLFDVATGTELFKLTASDAAAGDHFGRSVAISGNIAIVGAWQNDDLGTDSGSAYLFDVTTGTELFKLTAGDGAAFDGFGFAVAVSGNIAVVGALYNGTGSAYIFDATTGDQLFMLTASDPGPFGEFGASVAISGTTIIVGAPASDAAGVGGSSGAAYLFDAITGTQIAEITASDAGGGDLFGLRVDISGAVAIVSATLNDDAGGNSGSAYFFGADHLTSDPIDGGTIVFTLNPDTPATLDDIISLINTGVDGTVIDVTGFAITGLNADLFDLTSFAPATLTAGGSDSVAYDLSFLGSAIGSYSAVLTVHTDSGDVTYNLAAQVVPTPTGLPAAGLAMFILATKHRRRRRDR